MMLSALFPPVPWATGLLWWTGLGLTGLLIGLIGGMFGIGGGFLLIPMLHIGFHLPLPVAVGTALCQAIGTATAAYRRHRRLQQGEVKIDWIMLAGGMLGAPLGARVLRDLTGLRAVHLGTHTIPAVKFWVSLLYIVLLTLVSGGMLWDAWHRPASRPLPPGILTRLSLPPLTTLPNSQRRVPVFVLTTLGLLLGVVSGLIGLGGGIVLMPILMYGIGMRLRMAAGTGIVLLLATASLGTLEHVRLGNVHLGVALVLLMGSTLAAPFGATLTARMDGQRLRGIFAVLVLTAAAVVAWNLGR